MNERRAFLGTRKLPNASHLDLCHNAIGSEGMEILAFLLAVCTFHLDLRYNIAEALAHARAESLGGVLAQRHSICNTLQTVWCLFTTKIAKCLVQVRLPGKTAPPC